MESLKFCKFLLRLLGLWPIDQSGSLISMVLRYMGTMIFSAVLLVALSLYILFYSDEMNEMIETGFACFAFATSMFIYCWMIKRKPLINSAITQLDTVIDQSKCCFHSGQATCAVKHLFIRRVKKSQLGINEDSIADNTPEILYQQAESQYTKLSRRYFIASISIVCFYGLTLMIIPINDAYHGSLDASNWTTLFKSVYVIPLIN